MAEAAIAETTKRCTRCQCDKPTSDFAPRKSRAKAGGVPTISPWCRQCVRDDARERMAVKRATPEGKAAHREAVYRCRSTKDRTKEHRRQRRRYAEQAGREYVPRAERQAKAAEREAARLAERERKARNRKPWNEPSLSKAEQFALRYRLDPQFNLAQRLRAAMRRTRQGTKLAKVIRGAVTRGGESPSATAFVGYSMAALRAHLEARFTYGMNWQRFCAGEIHIDHIRPLSSYDLSDPVQLRAAWQLHNLQPLWAADNLSKGARWGGHRQNEQRTTISMA